MRYRSDLERLATLDAATIEAACTDVTALRATIADAVDEYLDYDAHADDTEADDPEIAAFCRQEASAWRATVGTLRLMLADTGVSAAGRRSA